MPLPEDKGILILASDMKDPRINDGYFIDLKEKKIKESKFEYSIGTVNHWHNSYFLYEKRINFITDLLQILRFEIQSCEWSLFDL